MADKLESIVQRMIDAGEPEDNIATVIRSFSPTQEEIKSQGDQIVTGQSGTPSAFARVGQALAANPMIQSAAHPESISDMLTLLIPAGVEGAVMAGKSYMSAAEEAAKTTKSLKAFPKELYKVLKRNATAPYPIVGFDRYAPNVSGAITHGTEGAANIPHSVIEKYAPNISGDIQLGTEGAADIPASVIEHYAPNVSGGVQSGVEAATVAAPKQATYIKLPSGDYGLQGADLKPGDIVHTMSRSGIGKMLRVGEVLPNGTATIQTKAPEALAADMIAKLRDKMNAPMLAKNPQARAAIATAIKRLGGTP